METIYRAPEYAPLDPTKGRTLGDIFKRYETEHNPVTRAVFREIIARRLDRIESGA